jgi:hypothetical protein
MPNWRTVGVRLKDEDVATLNQRLKQLGYSSLNELVGGIATGVVTNKQVVEELADVIAGKIVNNLLTMQPVPRMLARGIECEKEPRAGRDPTTYCLQGPTSATTRVNY